MASPISNNVMTFMSKEDEMYVTKRDGNREIVSFDKILKRIRNIGLEAGIKINYTSLVMKVIDQLYDGISTTKIDELSAEQCASMSSIHPDYNNLAGRITISNHHKNTESSFCEVMSQLYNYTDFHNKNKPLVSQQLYDLTLKYKKELDEICVHERDYLIEYFGFKTLERAYLMKIHKITVERPQHMWLRVAIGIHGDDLEKIIETYELMSQKYFTHATPTLFNSGTPRPQLSSCFLIAMEDDSIDGIYNTLKDCALISKWSGGIGLHVHNVRASGSHIRGTNGSSNGIVPMLKVFNNTAKYVDQCVIPESIIYTTQGPKQIQHCIAGETEIYNLNGETEVIQNVLEHSYDGEILEIETMHSIHPLKITSEHPIFALQGQMLDKLKRMPEPSNEQLMSLFEWVDAKELTIGDMVVFPIPTFEKDVSSITEDDCYFYGLILGYGSMSNNTETTHSISINKKSNPSVSDFIVDYFNRKYVKYTLNTYDDIIEIHWDRSIHLPFRYIDFYDENKKLRIQSKWINLPIHKSKFILKGLLQTDECNNTELVFDCASYNLIESLRFLLLKLGILSSKFCDNQNRIDYRISVPKTREICELMDIQFTEEPVLNFYKFGSFLLDRITNVSSNKYTGVLYDLQMGKQHDYLLHNGLVHNGGGRRNGSFAIYLEPWHADVEMFLQMRKNHGDEELKARDLFYALWIPDLFMERIKTDGSWTLMCPDECPGLSDVYGEEFVELYTKYESEGRGKKTVKARDLWFQVLDAQMETGTPYILYKDACNKKSNQKNIGIIKSSNLCTEILEVSDENETAVCNLGSIALPAFIESTDGNPSNYFFNHDNLHRVTKVLTKNLNKIIDVNYYPTPKTERSNKRHRPIGIGVQGLADVFMMLRCPFGSDQSRQLNRDIFETIYHAALEASCELAERDGAYETFIGSPASQGILQFDMWNVTPSSRYDWASLKQCIIGVGLRNSLLLAPMPTASTSQILGYNECIEPITSNIYNRRTLAGEFILANKYLMRDLLELGLWNEKIKNNIIANHGSVQQIEQIPQEIRDIYKTVWEIPMRTLIDMAADRGAYVCQSQSLNLWLEDPNYSTLTSMHFYSWSKGLKTGIYYLRRRGRHQAQQFTIEPEKNNLGGTYEEMEDEICEMCSS